MLLMFYTPWCGACKSFKPIFAEVASLVKDEGTILAAVDCELGKDVEFYQEIFEKSSSESEVLRSQRVNLLHSDLVILRS